MAKKKKFSVFKGKGKATFAGIVRKFFYSGNRAVYRATG